MKKVIIPRIFPLVFIQTSKPINWSSEMNNERLQRKLYELSFTEIDEPTRVNYLHAGCTSASVVLISGHYDIDNKAIRGKDSDGEIYYIPHRNIQSIS